MTSRANPGYRPLAGCFYLGCVAPLTFTVLACLILAQAIARRLRQNALLGR